MKTGLITLALLLAACGGSSTKNDMAQLPDLTAPADLSATADLAQLTCKQAVACVTGCSGQGMGTCIKACIANAGANALTYLAPLEACAKPACYDADAGSDACATIGTGACETCIMTSCSSQYTACEAN